jgi:hypothetical protein
VTGHHLHLRCAEWDAADRPLSHLNQIVRLLQRRADLYVWLSANGAVEKASDGISEGACQTIRAATCTGGSSRWIGLTGADSRSGSAGSATSRPSGASTSKRRTDVRMRLEGVSADVTVEPTPSVRPGIGVQYSYHVIGQAVLTLSGVTSNASTLGRSCAPPGLIAACNPRSSTRSTNSFVERGRDPALGCPPPGSRPRRLLVP